MHKSEEAYIQMKISRDRYRELWYAGLHLYDICRSFDGELPELIEDALDEFDKIVPKGKVA